jgi:hypothetical protein
VFVWKRATGKVAVAMPAENGAIESQSGNVVKAIQNKDLG